ncbi:MAG: GNAT family N-acetyltransferase [Chitinophagaceae bacterium]|jgi:ribosomal protein S18 acetylase RimI-like enzyme|nr:MAG: GNAT family N-acetyltransferase [Chitinophagaceae bacterium]
MITFIEAAKDQLTLVHKLAYRIWPSTFKDILSDAQMAYMLDWMYSLPSLQKQMEEGCYFLLAKDDNNLIGYASYQFNVKEKMTRLHKIYLLPSSQGKGIGKQMILEIIKRAKENDQDTLQLNVNRSNKAALVYAKLGFHIIREEDNDIGHGYFMNDYVMELNL